LRVEVEPLDESVPTFTVIVRAGKAEHRFVVGWASEGWPADVARLLRLAPAVDVVSARAVSIGARESLAARSIGWIDERGGAYLTLPSGLVVVRDTAGQPQRPAPDASWARSTVAVAEAILSGTDPRVDSVQHATGLSRGAVAKALAQLDQGGFLDRKAERGPGSARHVTDAAGLLDRYSTAVAALVDKTPVIKLHRLWDDPLGSLIHDIAPRLRAEQIAWAATGAAASMLLAPHLSNLTIIELYIDDALAFDVERLAELLDARIVERGHRIEIRSLPNPITATAGPVIDGVRCAPPARVYADLLAKGGRSAEAAQHLREVLGVGTTA
jgi:hypothetical protein